MKGKVIAIIAIIAVVVFGSVFLIVNMLEGSDEPEQVSQQDATKIMEKLSSKINVINLPPIKAPVDLEEPDMKDSLPDISKYPAVVNNTTSEYIEIFSSPEKAGTGKNGWLNEIANRFNKSGANVNGTPVSVMIREIVSGQGTDYISSGKYMPDVFMPSNILWGEALKSKGVDITLVEEGLAGNTAGVALSRAKHDEIQSKYGKVDISAVTQAVINDEITMGYTNPFASSTGMNFLVSALYSFDQNDPLGAQAVEMFEKFQMNIPYVAYTTLQMVNSAQSGVLDGFVMEHQQLSNSLDLRSSFVFTPFGVRHDNPVYEIGQLSQTKKETLRMFIELCKSAESQKLATEYGFNGESSYKYEFADKIDGGVVSAAQKLWKEKKNAGRKIISVFVADISGSMDGEPINKLKESLIKGSNHISKECAVGLITFSNSVNIALPIADFDLNQRSLFTGAVKNMQASGGTRMYEAIVIAEKMLAEAKLEHPDAKLMLFVLTDGEANGSLTLKDTREMIEGLEIPIYTIGYNADIDSLSLLSEIHEAASINADTDDVVYKLENLFKAEM